MQWNGKFETSKETTSRTFTKSTDKISTHQLNLKGKYGKNKTIYKKTTFLGL